MILGFKLEEHATHLLPLYVIPRGNKTSRVPNTRQSTKLRRGALRLVLYVL